MGGPLTDRAFIAASASSIVMVIRFKEIPLPAHATFTDHVELRPSGRVRESLRAIVEELQRGRAQGLITGECPERVSTFRKAPSIRAIVASISPAHLYLPRPFTDQHEGCPHRGVSVVFVAR